MAQTMARKVWQTSALFKDAPGEVLEALIKASQTRRWEDGAVLFQRGDPGDYMLIVQSGLLRLSLITPQGQQLTLGQAGPGELVGELAVVDNQPRSADATAVGELTAQVLTRQMFHSVAKAHPEIQTIMLRHLAGLVRNTNDRLEAIALYRLEARLARFLLAEVTRQHGSSADATAQIDLLMGQGDMALMLGASRPKVSGALRKFTQAGVVTRTGKSLICDVEALADLAEPD